MQRLLALKLDATGCDAEAWLNGVAVARVDAARPRERVPIHEYTLAGANRLELVVSPVPLSDNEPKPVVEQTSDGLKSARLHLLLPRAGKAVDEGSARELTQLEWAPRAGQRHAAPVRLTQDISLPVDFARWRWVDAPLADPTPELQARALTLLQGLAAALGRGEIETFMAATRLRTEELAAAYGETRDDAAERLRAHLAALHAAGAFVWWPIDETDLLLRRLAGGRLLECLDPSGEPALRTVPDATGRAHSFPMRLAAVEGELYVLR